MATEILAGRSDPNATTEDRLKAQFKEWYDTEAAPAYKRLVDVERYATDYYPKLAEQVQILNGTRNLQSIPASAIRYQDLRHIAGLPSVPMARKVTGTTVSVEQYNRLVEDVNLLYARLGALASIISQKIPK